MSDLRDNVVFITGGGSGLGLALVERFIEEGAQVATLELSPAKVASLRQRFGEHVLAIEGNVTCYADYQRAVDQILTAFGKLDCFIGNAGIWDHNASLVNTPADALESGFHELFNVNVLGYLLGAKACASRDLTANYTCFPMSSISPMNVHRSPKRCCWTTIRNFSRYSPLTGGGNTTYSCIWVLLYRRSAAKRISWCWLMGRVIRGIGY